MLIIPAIDILDGKVVRLQRGDFQKSTVYNLSPLEFAKKWQDEGADFIHIVDLGGARDGVLKNFDVIKEIIKNVEVRFEVGGGIRGLDSIRAYLQAGAQRLVLSTKLLEDESFLANTELKGYLDKIAVSLDIKNMEGADIVTGATGGWLKKKDVLIDIPSFIKTIVSSGIKYINFSDVTKDGMLSGMDPEKILLFLKQARAATASKLLFTYAGGISSLDDLKRLNALGEEGVDAVIVGRALYENKFSLKEAVEAVIC